MAERPMREECKIRFDGMETQLKDAGKMARLTPDEKDKIYTRLNTLERTTDVLAVKANFILGLLIPATLGILSLVLKAFGTGG